jgi:hypothetical protein
MPTYVFECPECGRRREKFLPMSRRDFPVLSCLRHPGPVRMNRIFTPFQFCANLEKDKPENQVLRILSGGSSSSTDWKEVERQQAQQSEASLAVAEQNAEASKYVPMEALDIQGAWTAAHAGPANLERWRNDHIRPDFSPAEIASATEEMNG